MYLRSYGAPGYVDAASQRARSAVHAHAFSARETNVSSSSERSGWRRCEEGSPEGGLSPSPSRLPPLAPSSRPSSRRSRARLSARSAAFLSVAAALTPPPRIRTKSALSVAPRAFLNAALSPRRHVGSATRTSSSSSAPGSDLGRFGSTHASSSASHFLRGSPLLTAFSRSARGTRKGSPERPAALETARETVATESGSSKPACRAARRTETNAPWSKSATEPPRELEPPRESEPPRSSEAVPRSPPAPRARSRGTIAAPSCLSKAGSAYFPAPSRSRPGERSAATRGGIHQERQASKGPEAASIVTSSLPGRRPPGAARFVRRAAARFPSARVSSSEASSSVANRAPEGLGWVSVPRSSQAFAFFRSSSSSLSSRSRAAASWLTSVAAAVHTPSSRIAKMVSSRRSGRAARIARAPRRGTTAASGAYRPFRDGEASRSRDAASRKNASLEDERVVVVGIPSPSSLPSSAPSARSPPLEKTKSSSSALASRSCSNAACTSFTV